jgi:hypothetical protein
MTPVAALQFDDSFYGQIHAEISQLYTGARDFTLAGVHDVAVLMQSIGNSLSAGETSRQQLMGASLSWLGAGLETGTLGPVPAAFNAETMVRAGFEVGSASDVLEFRDGLFADAAAALAAATASGNDTLITIDAGNTVLLKNVAVANLHAGDFHIV